MYRDLADKITCGLLRYGDVLPSMNDLCTRYNVGIRTVRDVVAALKEDGFIATEERKRATVSYRANLEDGIAVGARSLIARRSTVLESLQTLELLMPMMLWRAARSCSVEELDALRSSAYPVDYEMRSGDWRVSRSSVAQHELLKKADNPLFVECFASLELASIVPVYPGYADPYAEAVERSGHVLKDVFDALKLGSYEQACGEISYMFADMAEYIVPYLDALEADYPIDDKVSGLPYTWNARAGREYAYAQHARDVISRIASGEYADGDLLPSIAEFAEMYDASLSTIQKTLEMINALGIVETVNGCGTRVRLSNMRFDPRFFGEPSYKRDTEVFLAALDMMGIVLPVAVKTTAGRFEDVVEGVACARLAETGEWAGQGALMKGVIGAVRLQPLRAIMEELNELLFWGNFFVFFGPTRENKDTLLGLSSDAYAALEKRDVQAFSDAMADYYQYMLVAIKAFLSQVERQ